MSDLGGVWRTVGGRRIFIKDGEDLATAMKNSGKFGNKEQNEKKEIDYTDFEKSKVKETLYHGTNKDFEEFKLNQGKEGNGALWFADDKMYAEEMAYELSNSYKGNTMYEVKINVQNPETVELSSREFADPSVEKDFILKAKKDGKDSVIFKEKKKDGTIGQTFYAVFSSEQVKIEKKYNT